VKIPSKLLAAMLAVFGTAGLLGETYRTSTRIPTAMDPNSVYVADLNGDGLPDIVWGAFATVGSNSATIHTLLAQASGGYQAGPVLTLPASVTPYCQLADVTRDGAVDLICPYVNGINAAIEVFPGRGDGSFASALPLISLPSSPTVYWSPVIHLTADVNSDSNPDIIISNLGLEESSGSSTFILLGNGKGGFTLTATVGGVGVPQLIDLNSDGKLDIVFSNNHQFWLGDGKGNFHLGTQTTLGVNAEGICEMHDMDGDGIPDAVCGNEVNDNGDLIGGTQLLIFHGNGDATFASTPIQTINYGEQNYTSSGFGTFLNPIKVLDVNGDQIQDILGVSGDGLDVLLGHSSLSFDYPVHYAVGQLPFSGVFGGPDEFHLQIADLNHDGYLDLVTTGPNGVYITYGQSKGTFDAAPAYEVAQVAGYTTVADFNEDGKLDLAATGDAQLELSLGNGDGTLQQYMQVPGSGFDYTSGSPILTGDFNGDHHQDLLAVGKNTQSQTGYTLFSGHGDGTFSAPQLIDNGVSLWSTGVTAQVSDLNLDGLDDLVTVDTGQIYSDLSQSDGTFKLITTTIPSNLGSNYVNQTPIALGDINHDGFSDLVIATASNLYVALGDGTGAFSTNGTLISVPSYLGVTTTETYSVAIADLDMDGNLDVAVTFVIGPSIVPATEAIQSVTYAYYGNGDGTFTAPQVVGTFDRVLTQIYAADMNGDGYPDLILDSYYPTNAAVAIVHSLPPGRSFDSETDSYAGIGMSSLSAVDWNQDGFRDLIISNGNASFHANSVTALINQGNPNLVRGTLSASPKPSAYGQPITLQAAYTPPASGLISGIVTFWIDGKSAGSGQLSGNIASVTTTALLAIGPHTATAKWGGSSLYNALALSTPLQVTKIPSIVNLSSSLNPAPASQTVTFTAAVSGSSAAVPPASGTITFFDGTSSLGSSSLVSGQASLSVSSLAVGSHSITAQYSGDALFTPAMSQPLTQTIQMPDFSLAVTPSSLSIAAGQSGSATVSVASVYGFNQSVQFACSGLPAGSTCTFSPAAAIPGVTSTLTISISAIAQNVTPHSLAKPNGNNPMKELAVLFFGVISVSSIRRRWHRAFARNLYGLITLAGALAILSSCGGNAVKPNPPVTTNVTISASAGTLTHTATLTLTVE
jgi:hypothetical protein